MAQSSFDEVLARVNQLPPSEQQKLYKVLSAKLSRSDSRARDKHAPLIVENADFSREMEWLNEHRTEYAGRWVALSGERLIAHGASASLSQSHSPIITTFFLAVAQAECAKSSNEK